MTEVGRGAAPWGWMNMQIMGRGPRRSASGPWVRKAPLRGSSTGDNFAPTREYLVIARDAVASQVAQW